MVLDIVAYASLAAFVIVFILGCFALRREWTKSKEVAEKVKETVDDTSAMLKKLSSGNEEEFKPYAGIDISGSLEALGKLATALKDLDISSRLFFISLAFLAVAAATVGLDAIGTGLGDAVK